MIKYLFLIAIVTFFALNMGGSGIAPSFASVYGAKILKRRRAVFLFSIFVVFGALLLGKNVTKTLSRGIIPSGYVDFDTVLIILIAAASGLFIANLLKVPQSTSQVTIGAIVGVGIYLQELNTAKLLFLLGMWIILPLTAYISTFLIFRLIYPPRKENLWFYEKIARRKKRLKIFAIVASCYVAFAIGANNVANAVGPLVGGGIIRPIWGLVLIAPIFGIGALVFGKHNLMSFGKNIVPLGTTSSSITCFVTATLLIFASTLGIPQSLVQLKGCAIMAIGSVKNEKSHNNRIKKRIFFVWLVTPIIALILAYILIRLKYTLYQ